MKMILLMMNMIYMILIILMMLLILSSKKMFSDREKNSPFECGFDPMNSARMPFSLQFFLIAMIFIIFDVELTLLLPLILVINYSNLMMMSLTTMIFIIILLIGLLHEWGEGALNWIK